MNKKNVFLSFVFIGLLVVLAASIPLQAAIPAEERAALIALYNATDGDNWADNSGWKGNNNEWDGFSQIGSEWTWYGIIVSSDHVTKIHMTNNHLIGSIPHELGNLINLKELYLIRNQLSGSIPRELGNLRNLGDLRLFENQLSGCIPSELGNLYNLDTLWLDDNQLTGGIPAEIGNLSNLKSFGLTTNKLSGGIPPELGNLRNLESLFLGENQLSGGIPSELGNLKNLDALFLNDNQLSGGIPAEFGNLNNLRSLWLHYNQLSGGIPVELGNLRNLISLCLGYNQLSGGIPAELRNLSNLNCLALNSNQLTGGIPADLGNLSNLEYLYLYKNQLTGGIPAELGNLINLKRFDLSSNQLTGNIPISLMNLTNLWWLDISYNCLSTDDPDLRTWLNSFDPDWESNQDQCGEDEDKYPPFGTFETPVDGSTVCSSIPVTGWALDDTGIDHVKIYREQGSELVYIGDAVLVEGARPDVAAAFPGYPNNTKAGWGYMMLTNFLPNSGNGDFVIHAIATDFVGKTTSLGTKTIHCDNAHAVKPFGAIDTPTQGGSASGSSFINWGWVLTPQPNSIPTNGSTLNVYVDGVNLGHPSYNNYRPDIASFFPGYANSNGAAGFFYLDTTAYENGIHTIQWTATDSGGNTDGIGSRYFSISNTGTSASSEQSYQANAKPQTPIFNHSQIAHIPADYSVPVRVKRGFKEDAEPVFIHADETGMNRIDIKEVERVQIHLTDRCDEDETAGSLSSNSFTGYLEVNNRLEPLPVGSTLDTKRGIFYWQPGPGFIGEYRFVFIEKEQNTELNRKNIVVKIVPRFE